VKCNRNPFRVFRKRFRKKAEHTQHLQNSPETFTILVKARQIVK
jgi:hypothetical protein